MIKKNIEDVMHAAREEKNEKGKALNLIRDRAYDLYSSGKDEETVIAGTLSFARAALEAGKVTKADVEKEIAKILAIKLESNTKTR